jgi:hypothetical protein
MQRCRSGGVIHGLLCSSCSQLIVSALSYPMFFCALTGCEVDECGAPEAASVTHSLLFFA